MNLTGTKSWLAIFGISALAVSLLVWQFFPQIIEQVAAGIVAFFAFILGVIFKRKKS
jgi:hypothetical protein